MRIIKFKQLKVLLAAIVLTSSAVISADPQVETPSAGAMTSDLLIVRPLGLVATVLGTGVFVVSLPFTLAGGNMIDAGKTLVVGPAVTTFVRCLGCTKPGRKEKIAD